ncbi:hypothetical protein [Actinoplanes sp. NPDC051494]|uniref:hypothetical protein n=1 Tax=Actinoplanes sp. NPDC051494 TaxID=3363907 RepID=UPI003798B8D5
MPTLSTSRALVAGAALVAVGALAGSLLTRVAHDPHTATAEVLTGTVPWSNQQIRRFAFEADGEPRNPLGDQTFYEFVVDDLTVPGCLAGTNDDPVREDRRRVEVEAIHQSFDGPREVNIALSVRCLDAAG